MDRRPIFGYLRRAEHGIWGRRCELLVLVLSGEVYRRSSGMMADLRYTFLFDEFCDEIKSLLCVITNSISGLMKIISICGGGIEQVSSSYENRDLVGHDG